MVFGSKGWETDCADVFQITKGFSMNERDAESAKVVREFPQFGNLDKTKCVAASTTDEKAFTEKIFSTSAQKLTDLLFLSLTATFRARVIRPTRERERFFYFTRVHRAYQPSNGRNGLLQGTFLWSLWHFVASPVPVLDVLNALLYITFVLVLALVIFFSNLRNKHV